VQYTAGPVSRFKEGVPEAAGRARGPPAAAAEPSDPILLPVVSVGTPGKPCFLPHEHRRFRRDALAVTYLRRVWAAVGAW